MKFRFHETKQHRLVSTPFCIAVEGMATGTQTAKGNAVMLFNSLELAELGIEALKPKPENALAVQINLETFAPAAIAQGHYWATVDFIGGRFMGVVDLREIVEQLQND